MKRLLAVLFLAIGGAAYADETIDQQVAVEEETIQTIESDALSADVRLYDNEQPRKGGCGCGGKPKTKGK